MIHTSGPGGTDRGKRRPAASPPAEETVEQARVLDWSVDEESLLEPDWIWQRWLPRGRVTVLGTPSGSDFSGLIADLVARVTTGTTFPGLGPPTGLYCRRFGEKVAVVTAGGDPRRDFGRLVARAGGRLDQLHLTSGVVEPAGPDGYPVERPFNLPADFSLLRQWQFEENLPPAHLTIPRSPEDEPVSLLVIEALPRQVGKWRESELRTLLDQLNRLAFERHMAILLVTPLTVLPARLSAGKVTLAKAFGSSMLVESVGALWHIDQNLSHPDRFNLICHKLCQRPPSVAF
ncbi:MAG: AAA family ATPase [Planctomycetota bacterium]|nr:AAA family ATPase [Planctomycetota bacterium]